MSCERCGGFMVSEEFEDLQEEASRFRFTGWRCVMCGDIVDPLIAHRRAATPVGVGVHAGRAGEASLAA